MDFARCLFPNDFQILHNTGIFDYNVLLLGSFALNILLFPVTLVCLMLFAYYLIFRPLKRHTILEILLVTICAALILTCVSTWRPIFSKVCFARGYDNYLYDRNDKACEYYIQSFDLDNSFRRALKELISIYKNGHKSDLLLNRIKERVEQTDDVDIYLETAKLFEESGKYNKALDLYVKAKEKSEKIDFELCIIGVLIKTGEYNRAEQRVRQIMQNELNNEKREMLCYYKSLIEFNNKKYGAALKNIEKAMAVTNGEPLYLLQKAKILARVKRGDEAERILTQALAIRKEFPEAHFEKAKICYGKGDVRRAKEALIRTLYYDNRNSLAYVMLQMIEEGTRVPIRSLTSIQGNLAKHDETERTLKLKKGESTDIEILFETNSAIKRFKIGILEPYGFGVKCSKGKQSQIRGGEGGISISVSVNIRALRPDKINLGQPWLINVVFVDLDVGNYQYENVFASVQENESEEGRILLVITDDHEQTSDFPHKDKTPEIPEIDAYEMKMDLIDKGKLADEIANDYGIKWTHMIDIGSSFLRVKWIQELGEGWNDVWKRMSSYLKEARLMGHDIQLHIHAYGIPGNNLFRQYYDAETNTLRFKDNMVRADIGEKTYGAWALNYTNLGDFNDTNTKIGSIFQGVRLLEEELHEVDPNYMAIFFRAGEYEFGNGSRAIKESILALKKNNILAGSNAHEGIPYQRDFRFFKKLGTNAYFTKRDSIRERTSSLLDVGILEIVPVPNKNARNYLQPTDHWSHVKFNYDRCLRDGKIRPGIFVILEMEHLHNINAKYKWDSLERKYEDWGRMDEHFKQIRLNCPKIESVTISEAIKIYLDHYSPDIIAVRKNERKINGKLFSYDIECLGRDIEVSKERAHFVSIKPPSYLVGRIDKIELIHNDKILKAWRNLNSYLELQFEITNKTGYSLNVYAH